MSLRHSPDLRTAARQLSCAIAAAVVVGCAPGRGAPDPLTFLRPGVDPAQEARAVRRDFARVGYRLAGQVRGSAFVALGFARSDGATAVRVVTRRGIEMALDAPDPNRRRYARVSLPSGAPLGRDLDGDGRPELAVAVALRPHHRRCVGIVRVLEAGFVREVAVDPGRARRGSCIEDLRDVGGDARPEALVVEHDRDLAAATDAPVPTVALPLAGHGGRWSPALGPAYAAYWKGEVDRRRVALGQARKEARPADGLRLAVELAALARLRGASMPAQVRAFDGALAGMVQPASLARVVDCVRARVAAGWPGGGPACYTRQLHVP